MNLQIIVEVLDRAGRLFGLALAPLFLPPEPAPAAQANFAAFLVLLAFGLVIAAAWRFRTRIASREGTLASLLVLVAILASMVGAAYFRDVHAPLGRGVLFVAVPLWTGLAATVWVSLRHRFQDEPASKHKLAALVTLGVGLAQLAASASWITSIDAMWWKTLARGGNDARAFDELTKTNHDPLHVKSVVDRCLATNPTACFCLAKRAELHARVRDYDDALTDARAAVTLCPTEISASLALVGALVAKGDAKQAEEVARTALSQSTDPKLHYVLAVALQGQGRIPDAMAAARQAIELGAGRDAQLFLAALAILSGDLDAATTTLNALLETSPNDADARYNLALIADKKNDYNRAREGYLAALKADPKLASARYNLALLTLRRGVTEEARHHARKFAELAPGDPRIAELMKRIDTAKPAPP